MYELNEQEFRKAVLNGWPEPPKEMIYIVAGNVRQARLLAFKYSIQPLNWKFVNGREDLRGASGVVLYTGNYYQRAEFQAIEDEINIGVATGVLKRLDINE